MPADVGLTYGLTYFVGFCVCKIFYDMPPCMRASHVLITSGDALQAYEMKKFQVPR